MPLHCSAAAKSILAFQPGELVESLVLKESVELFTEYTKADIRSLQCELAEVAKTRVAFCIEEMEPGVSAMATPVFHRKGEVMASIGLIASSHYIAANREDLVRELVCIEEKASARMASAYLLTSTGRGVI
jgi:DNA-binding IclR family transcriptional regulator